MKPEIRTIDFVAYPSGKEEYAAVRIIIGDDFYIDVGCKVGNDKKSAGRKARVIAHEVQAALLQIISIRESAKQ